MKTSHLLRPLAAVLLAAVGAAAEAAPIVFSAAGTDAAAIQPVVDQFRTELGTLNANVPGSFGSGRREINWDGVPDGFADPNELPLNFFNLNSPRGAEFATPGFGVRVSGDGVDAPADFAGINPTYGSLFTTFSAPRLFTAVGSNLVDVRFFVPGSTVSAFTTGFGAVFTDVDLPDSTSLEFFGLDDQSLGLFFVPPVAAADESLSFLGVRFDAGERIGRVRIISGNAALGANVFESGAVDLVVMDDFIYGEPLAAAVPEPATLLLLGAAVAAGLATRRTGRERRSSRR